MSSSGADNSPSGVAPNNTEDHVYDPGFWNTVKATFGSFNVYVHPFAGFGEGNLAVVEKELKKRDQGRDQGVHHCCGTMRDQGVHHCCGAVTMP